MFCNKCNHSGIILASTTKGLEVQRCDTCERFSTDDIASEFAVKLAHAVMYLVAPTHTASRAIGQKLSRLKSELDSLSEDVDELIASI